MAKFTDSPYFLIEDFNSELLGETPATQVYNTNVGAIWSDVLFDEDGDVEFLGFTDDVEVQFNSQYYTNPPPQYISETDSFFPHAGLLRGAEHSIVADGGVYLDLFQKIDDVGFVPIRLKPIDETPKDKRFIEYELIGVGTVIPNPDYYKHSSDVGPSIFSTEAGSDITDDASLRITRIGPAADPLDAGSGYPTDSTIEDVKILGAGYDAQSNVNDYLTITYTTGQDEEIIEIFVTEVGSTSSFVVGDTFTIPYPYGYTGVGATATVLSVTATEVVSVMVAHLGNLGLVDGSYADVEAHYGTGLTVNLVDMSSSKKTPTATISTGGTGYKIGENVIVNYGSLDTIVQVTGVDAETGEATNVHLVDQGSTYTNLTNLTVLSYGQGLSVDFDIDDGGIENISVNSGGLGYQLTDEHYYDSDYITQQNYAYDYELAGITAPDPSTEIWFRKDSAFHDWLKIRANEFYLDKLTVDFILRDYVNTDTTFIYFGQIYSRTNFPYDDTYYIVYEGMKDWVQKALPEPNRKPNFVEFLDTFFDMQYNKGFRLLKDVWSLRDADECDKKFLGYLPSFYGMDNLDVIPEDFESQYRQYSKYLVDIMKRKGSYASIYGIYELFSKNSPNPLVIYERVHTGDVAQYAEEGTIDTEQPYGMGVVPPLDTVFVPYNGLYDEWALDTDNQNVYSIEEGPVFNDVVNYQDRLPFINYYEYRGADPIEVFTGAGKWWYHGRPLEQKQDDFVYIDGHDGGPDVYDIDSYPVTTMPEDNIVSPYYRVDLDIGVEPISDDKILDQYIASSLYKVWEKFRPIHRQVDYNIVYSPFTDMSGKYQSYYKYPYQNHSLSKTVPNIVVDEDTQLFVQRNAEKKWNIPIEFDTNSFIVSVYDHNLEKLDTVSTYVYANIVKSLEITDAGTNYPADTRINFVSTTGGNGTGLAVDYITNESGNITDVIVHVWGIEYQVGDVITIPRPVGPAGDDCTFTITETTNIVAVELEENERGLVLITKAKRTSYPYTNTDWLLNHNYNRKEVVVQFRDITGKVIDMPASYYDANNLVVASPPAYSTAYVAQGVSVGDVVNGVAINSTDVGWEFTESRMIDDPEDDDDGKYVWTVNHPYEENLFLVECYDDNGNTIEPEEIFFNRTNDNGDAIIRIIWNNALVAGYAAVKMVGDFVSFQGIVPRDTNTNEILPVEYRLTIETEEDIYTSLDEGSQEADYLLSKGKTIHYNKYIKGDTYDQSEDSMWYYLTFKATNEGIYDLDKKSPTDIRVLDYSIIGIELINKDIGRVDRNVIFYNKLDNIYKVQRVNFIGQIRIIKSESLFEEIAGEGVDPLALLDHFTIFLDEENQQVLLE